MASDEPGPVTTGRSGWCTAPPGARPKHEACRSLTCTCTDGNHRPEHWRDNTNRDDKMRPDHRKGTRPS